MKKILLFIMFYFFIVKGMGQPVTQYTYDNPSAGLATAYSSGSIPDWYTNLNKYWYSRLRRVSLFADSAAIREPDFDALFHWWIISWKTFSFIAPIAAEQVPEKWTQNCYRR
jgi:hypothetical protein